MTKLEIITALACGKLQVRTCFGWHTCKPCKSRKGTIGIKYSVSGKEGKSYISDLDIETEQDNLRIVENSIP